MYEVVGYHFVSYTSKKTGLPVSGMELYTLSDFSTNQRKDSSGRKAEKWWVKDVDSFLAADVKVADTVDLLFDQYRNVAQIVK